MRDHHRVRLDWVRHGQNPANLTRTLSHRVVDLDLTDVGLEQAETLARRLAQGGQRYTVLASSPLRRAHRTARILGAELGLAVDPVLEDLREIAAGDLDGRSDDEAWATHDEVVGAWAGGGLEARFPGGEDGHELLARLERALTVVAHRAGDGPALVVAHVGNLAYALPHLTGTGSLPDGFRLGNCDVAHLELDLGGGPLLRLLDWTDRA